MYKDKNSKEGLDLLIVKPASPRKIYGELSASLSAIEPPLFACVLAGFIRQKGFKVGIIDVEAQNLTPQETAEKIIERTPLLVNIAVGGANPSASSTPLMIPTREILNALKRRSPDTKTILSGIHPSALPERTLKEEQTDFVCRGESFLTILDLLTALKSGKDISANRIAGLWQLKDGKVESNGWGALVENIDALPLAAWDLLPMEKYRAHNWHCFEDIDRREPYAVIYTSLGCPFVCTYCNIHAMYNGTRGIRFRAAKKVVDEIDLLVKNYNVRNIKIFDELFVLQEKRTEEFCDLIISRGYDLNMWAYARIDTINEKLLKKLKKAGVHWLAYGIESGNRSIREGVAKGRFDQQTIKRVIDMTHEAGIYIVGNFIFGLPQDNKETMQETLDLAIELNCEYTNFYVAMAYPGSPLYEEVLKEGVQLPKTWLGFAQFSEETFPLPTRYCTSAEVLRFRDMAFQQFHSNPAYLAMIRQKFGVKTEEHIRQMLQYKIQRKYA